MTRLIDADALEEKLQYVYSCDYIDSKSKEGVVSDIIDEIDNAPTVDIQTAVWELYQRHQSHLGTYVYEFGIELKELLGRYERRQTVSDEELHDKIAEILREESGIVDYDKVERFYKIYRTLIQNSITGLINDEEDDDEEDTDLI